MPTVTWLHISDLHWRESEAYDANVVAQALLRDLAQRTGIAPCLEHIDFIFVTGDIAFASKPEEYVLAQRFLDDLRRTSDHNTGINHLSRLLTQDARDEFREWLQLQEDISPGRVIKALDRLAYCAYSRGVAADERIGVELWKEFSRPSKCTDICTPDALYSGTRKACTVRTRTCQTCG